MNLRSRLTSRGSPSELVHPGSAWRTVQVVRISLCETKLNSPAHGITDVGKDKHRELGSSLRQLPNGSIEATPVPTIFVTWGLIKTVHFVDHT